MNVFLYSNKIKLLTGDSNVWKNGIKKTNKNQYWWTNTFRAVIKTDIENGFVDRDGEGEGGMNWENSTDIHFHM